MLSPGDVLYQDKRWRWIFQPDCFVLIEEADGVKNIEHSVRLMNELSDLEMEFKAAGKSVEKIERAKAALSEAYNLDKYEVVYADGTHQFLWSSLPEIALQEMRKRAEKRGGGWKIFQRI